MSDEAHSFSGKFESVNSVHSGYTWQRISKEAEVVARLQELIAETTERVALVTVELYFEREGRDASKLALLEEKIEQSTHYLLDALRVLVRKTDNVYVLGSTCYFLLLGANIEGGSIVCNRLWDALLWRVHNCGDADIPRPRSMCIGFAAYPHIYEDAQECVQDALEAKHSFEIQAERRRNGTRTPKPTNEVQSTLRPLHNEHGFAAVAERQEDESELPLLARRLGIPYLSLLPRKKRAQIQQLIALELAQELRCYPLGRERGMLTVAVADPQDSTILERLRRETGLHIFPVLTQPQELQMALDQLL